MSYRHHHFDANGFPDLSIDPGDLTEIPEEATPLELARAYGTVTLRWQSFWPRVVDALHWLRGAWLGVDGKLEKLAADIRLLKQMTGGAPMRQRLPSLSEYDPEMTPEGGIRISVESWQAVQLRLQELDSTVAGVESQRKAAEARAQGAQEAMAQLEKQEKRRRDLVLFSLAILTPIVGALSWLLTHYLHL